MKGHKNNSLAWKNTYKSSFPKVTKSLNHILDPLISINFFNIIINRKKIRGSKRCIHLLIYC